MQQKYRKCSWEDRLNYAHLYDKCYVVYIWRKLKYVMYSFLDNHSLKDKLTFLKLYWLQKIFEECTLESCACYHLLDWKLQYYYVYLWYYQIVQYIPNWINDNKIEIQCRYWFSIRYCWNKLAIAHLFKVTFYMLYTFGK